MDLGNINQFRAVQISLIRIQQVLLVEQVGHLLETVFHTFLLGVDLLLQFVGLVGEAADGGLDLLLTAFNRDGCLQTERLVGMDSDTTAT